jgi:hypothetical protein
MLTADSPTGLYVVHEPAEDAGISKPLRFADTAG